MYVAFEGEHDEVSIITEAQWRILHTGFVRLNNGRGLTSKATAWSPELGIVSTNPAPR